MIDAVGHKIAPGDFVAFYKTSGNNRTLLSAVIVDTYTERYRIGGPIAKVKLIPVKDYAGFNDGVVGLTLPAISADRVAYVEWLPTKTKKSLEQAYKIYWETQGV